MHVITYSSPKSYLKGYSNSEIASELPVYHMACSTSFPALSSTACFLVACLCH